MLKEVDELVGQVVKAIPVRKRQEIKFKQSEISERSKMSLNTDLSVVTMTIFFDFEIEMIQ